MTFEAVDIEASCCRVRSLDGLHWLRVPASARTSTLPSRQSPGCMHSHRAVLPHLCAAAAAELSRCAVSDTTDSCRSSTSLSLAVLQCGPTTAGELVSSAHTFDDSVLLSKAPTRLLQG